MKKILLIWLFGTLLFANHIGWMGDYDKALQLAQKSNKPLLVLLVKNDCTKCNEMIKTLFMNQPYIDKLNQNFICVIVNASHKHSYPIELYYSTTFPTLFFANTNEQFIAKPIYGTIDSSSFAKKINLLDKL